MCLKKKKKTELVTIRFWLFKFEPFLAHRLIARSTFNRAKKSNKGYRLKLIKRQLTLGGS